MSTLLSLRGLSAVKLALMAQQVRAQSAQVLRADPIAVIGMACRLPGGANSPAEFWTLLKEGREAIREVPAERWNADAWYSADPSAAAKSATKWGGFLDSVDGFDAAYFNILPREAERMDPQQRLLLEVAIEAFDDAGLSQERLRGSRTGVFIASYHNDYAQLQYNDLDAVDARTLTGTLHSVLANRVSYVLDLRGPSLSIDTACSSSLVAAHLACQSLRDGESDTAIAGGVSLMLTPDLMVSLSKVGFMAPDGRCKTFDELADGFGRGEGCGVVVLKRLADAVADGDRVLAVVRGSAVNSDGHSTLLAAPNGLAQQAMVREALANAQLEPGRISYVETHGTGTALGDPIEVEALAATVGRPSPGAGTCYLGAAKANVGHLEAGAGVVGLIKTVLMLRHEAIPPQPNFTRLSPHISLAGTRLAVPSTLLPWPRGEWPRCGAVSSFGVGGTNAHVILEEAPQLPAQAPEPRADTCCLLPLSAKSPEALDAMAQDLVGMLGTTNESLEDVCFTAAERRSHHDFRLAVVGRTKQEVALRLGGVRRDDAAWALTTGRRVATGITRVGFVFSGQGPQWYAMGRELLRDEPVFRDVITECDALLRPLSGWSLLEQLQATEGSSRLDDTEVAQPALFALQAGLAALWKSWGVLPAGVVGHSAGEIAALHVAGVLSLAEAIRVVWHRGRIMQEATGLGRMASVGLSAEAAARLVQPYGEQLSVAAINGPRSVVLSGQATAVEAALAILTARDVGHCMLPVQYAFHSAQMAPFQKRLTDALAGLRGGAPRVPVYSTVTGALLGGEPVGAAYFGRNVREPVRFADAMVAMADDDFDVFVEIGPHPVLAAAINECLDAREPAPQVLASLRRGRPERETLLQACAGLYAAGLSPAWDVVQPWAGRVVTLPAYPWQRKRHWIRQRPQASAPQGKATGHPLLGRRLPTAGSRVRIFQASAEQAHAWLADHRIFGKLLLPAAAVLEAFAAAAHSVLGVENAHLSAFTMLCPMVIHEAGEPATRWQVLATSAEAGLVALELHQAMGSEDTWQLIASASAQLDAPTTAIVESAAIEVGQALDAATIYRRFAELGVAFGPGFRCLTQVHRAAGVAEAWIELPDGLVNDGHTLHPVFLDGALQLCSLAGGGDAAAAAPAKLFLPLGADRFDLRASSATRLRARARVTETGASLSADLTLSAPDGTLVASLRGMRFVHADASSFAVPDAAGDLLYDVIWQRAAARSSVGRESADGTWLILADRGGAGDALANQLTLAGGRCVRVFAGTALASAAAGQWTADPARREHLPQVLAQAGPLRGVVHLWSLDSAPLTAAATASADGDDLLNVGSVLHLVQGLANAPAPLWLVSRGAHIASGQEAPDGLRPGAAGLSGLAGVVAFEHPELGVRVIDLDPGEPAAMATALLAELLQPDEASRTVALRGSERWVPQLARHCVGGNDAAHDGPMRWVLAQPGTFDGARLHPAPAAVVQPGELRLRVLASGINFRDVLLTLGMYAAQGVPLGAECSGVVTELGAGVSGFQLGDTVFGFAPGALGTEVVVPAAFVARVPATLSAEDAAALPVAFLTAYHGLHGLARLKAGERILIHAAAGGVGLAAVQLAQRCGAQVFATAGSADKRERLRQLGVAHVMDSRSLGFADEVRAATGGAGVHVVLNSLAGDFIPATLGVLGAGGRFLELGKRDIMTVASAAQARPDVHYHAYDLGSEAQADHTLLRPMFDAILAALADGSLRPLPVTVYPLEAAREAFRFMAQGRHIGKIVLRPATPASISAGATYWITGGFGGLGLETARWLVARGARHIVLSGRRPPGADAAAVIAELKALGGIVATFVADAGDRPRMAALLEEIGRSLPPLRGVIHAAGAVDDAVLLSQTWARCKEVLRGKAHGAWVLHDITRHLPLDFFVMYSAAGALLGAGGQGAYPAANAQLDALARARRRLGLPALSVGWGAWADVGMAARAAQGGHDVWAARGLGKITLASGFAALSRLMRDGASCAAVLPIDWPRFLAKLPLGADAGFFRAMAVAAPTGVVTAAPGSAILEHLRAAPSGQRRQILINHLGERALQVLGLDAGTPLNHKVALKDIGLDSLMAVELRNALAKSLAQPLPATLLFDYPSLDSLAVFLLRNLGLPAEVGDAPALVSREQVEIEHLSDEEAEAMLLKELESGPSEHT